MFRGELIHEVDRRVAKQWAAKYLIGAPFSRLRLSWKEQHCATLNPYRSVDCPYPERDCVLAFWQAVDQTIYNAERKHAMGYFRMMAKRSAIERAENKPLARERPRNTGDSDSSSAAGLPGDSLMGNRPGEATDPVDDETSLRRSHARPIAIGEMLGALNFRPRESGPPDGKAGGE